MNHLGFPLETVAVFVLLSVGAIAIDLFAHKNDQPMSLKSAIGMYSVVLKINAPTASAHTLTHCLNVEVIIMSV